MKPSWSFGRGWGRRSKLKNLFFYISDQVEHELLIKDLNTHLYLKSEKSRQKRTKLVAYMTDNASVGAKGLVPLKFTVI